MSFANYGYGYGGGDYGNEDYSGGNYNPKYHFQAAQMAGFDLSSDDPTQPKTVYVGNLDPSVTEEFIATLFGQIGPVTKTKVIFDANSNPYAFVEFADHYTATQALTAMNKRMLLDREMKVNWATQPGSQLKVDTSKHFHVFVGDLSPEVDNKALKEAFVPFGEISDAKVIRDPQTLKSKGYGFVSYPKREEAERAIEQMNGQWLGRRTIRTNWATRKPTDTAGGGYYGSSSKPSVDEIANQTGPENTSVYVGNIPPTCSDDDIRNVFKQYGSILDIRHFKAQGYAFVRFDAKSGAAKSIAEMNGGEFMGQSIRCSWGKSDGGGSGGAGRADLIGYGASNPAAGAFNGAAGGAAGATAQQQQWNQYYQYQQYYSQNPQLQQQWLNYYNSSRAMAELRIHAKNAYKFFSKLCFILFAFNWFDLNCCSLAQRVRGFAQTHYAFDIYEGASEDVSENTLLGKFTVVDSAATVNAINNLNINLMVDRSGNLTVSAGKPGTHNIHANYNLLKGDHDAFRDYRKEAEKLRKLLKSKNMR
uniref:RRM domain-containing protein n=1 Tax=Ditylenchus dipsaci TaxID=166011 RepID=A0A915ENC4_9BILA